jgi:23S rRNA pseudouridine1911/1915/1917 synthase
VEPGEAGRRLDVFLAERLALSRAQVRRLLERGAVRLDGRRAPAKGELLAAGSAVEVEPFRRPAELRIAPRPDPEIRILARGPGWLAVDKPAGMPVHPLEEEERGTVLNALVVLHPEIQGVGEGGLRSGVVHRLDVDTSGALLVATEQARWEALRAAFAEHRVEKLYRAIVVGRLREAGRVAVGLVTARHRPARVRVIPPEELERARGARVGEMSWRPLEQHARTTLVEVRPRTGFLHQIRATLAWLGFPVAGDRVYGTGDDPTGATRHMLHAARVASGDVAADCEDAADFAALLQRLRGALSASARS